MNESTGIKVKNIMTKRIVSTEDSVTVQEVSKKMIRQRVGSIIVTKKRRPIGIITETDIVKRVVALAKDPKKLRASDIMSSPIIYVNPEEDIYDVVKKMEKYKIRRFPVVENGKIVGILTNTDIARISPEMVDVLNLRLKLRAGLPRIEEGSTAGICDSCENYSDDLLYVNGRWVCEECR
ncbi:MAG: CBS domain-containing protein [Candidatus Aenigmatarchaeota archaeon]